MWFRNAAIVIFWELEVKSIVNSYDEESHWQLISMVSRYSLLRFHYSQKQPQTPSSARPIYSIPGACNMKHVGVWYLCRWRVHYIVSGLMESHEDKHVNTDVGALQLQTHNMQLTLQDFSYFTPKPVSVYSEKGNMSHCRCNQFSSTRIWYVWTY